MFRGKIGIITYYYQSTNYGGVLQAYALCKYLKNAGYNAEQIKYDYNSRKIPENNEGRLIRALKRIYIAYKRSKTNFKKKEKFEEFCSKYISSSDKIFSDQTVCETKNEYDFFICGSDQIWNPISMDENFFLRFIRDYHKKAAYAVSLGADYISEEKTQFYREMLREFKNISVREESGMEYLNSIGIQCCITPDPVFLLNQQEWNLICKDQMIKDEYILIYSIGTMANLYEFAKHLSKKDKIRIIDVSSGMNNNGRHGQVLPDIGPKEFLTLIRDAKYILTNSFHCTAFSVIFHKQFLVQKKPVRENKTANSRISTLLSAFGLEDRFVENEKIEHLWGIIDKEYYTDLMKYGQIGKEFIDSVLNKQ